ncbi:unnamed protein product [Linum tenue]|uniref:Uncharacterized protein n=1 Tax=Linum tenue TaxID=586396 RepID=A0AAV0HWX2_9ROSI|nr:unnamed protein product [Linum tenue]
MEEITEGVNSINLAGADATKKNRIQVSNTKKPLFFYVNLAKRYMQQFNEVELSALGMGNITALLIVNPGNQYLWRTISSLLVIAKVALQYSLLLIQ